jgi:H+-transporting ATPase
MLIRNETIRVELIVFLAIFADLATIAIAYDNAPYQSRPVEWQLPKIWFISVILGMSCVLLNLCLLSSYGWKGILLAAGTWVLRGTLFISKGGVIQNFGRYVPW